MFSFIAKGVFKYEVRFFAIISVCSKWSYDLLPMRERNINKLKIKLCKSLI